MSDYLGDVSSYARLVVELERKLKEQQQRTKDLEGILDVQKQMKIPLSVVKQFADQERQIENLENDIKFYKKFVPPKIIKEREQEHYERTRPKRGSLSSTLKKNK